LGAGGWGTKNQFVSMDSYEFICAAKRWLVIPMWMVISHPFSRCLFEKPGCLSENLGKKPNPYGGSSFFQVTKAIWEYSPNIWKSPYIATAITVDNVRSRLELAMSPQWQYRNWNDHGPFRQP